MDWVYLLTAIEGRIGRKPFWFAFLPLLAIDLAAYLLLNERSSSVESLLLTYPQFALFAKRGHDRNVSAWVSGLFFAGTVAFDLLVLLGLAESLDHPSTAILVAAIPVFILGLILIVDFGFRRGTPGPNRYGSAPRDARS